MRYTDEKHRHAGRVADYVNAVRARRNLERAVGANLGIAESHADVSHARKIEVKAYKLLTGGQLGEARRILAQDRSEG